MSYVLCIHSSPWDNEKRASDSSVYLVRVEKLTVKLALTLTLTFMDTSYSMGRVLEKLVSFYLKLWDTA